MPALPALPPLSLLPPVAPVSASLTTGICPQTLERIGVSPDQIVWVTHPGSICKTPPPTLLGQGVTVGSGNGRAQQHVPCALRVRSLSSGFFATTSGRSDPRPRARGILPLPPLRGEGERMCSSGGLREAMWWSHRGNSTLSSKDLGRSPTKPLPQGSPQHRGGSLSRPGSPEPRH